MSTVRQVAQSGCNGANTATFGVATVAGNLVVALLTMAGSSPTMNPTVLSPGTWQTLIARQQIDAPGDDYIGLFYGRVGTDIPAGTAYNLGSSAAFFGTAWELTDVSLAGATLLSATDAGPALPEDFGSLGDVPLGTVCIMGLGVSIQGGAVTETPDTGWTFRGGSWHVSCNSRPRHYPADLSGPVNGVRARATVDANVFGPSKLFGGVAVRFTDTNPPRPALIGEPGGAVWSG